MAKNIKSAKSIPTASKNYVAKVGKPKRPEGMSNAEWGTITGKRRMIAARKAMRGIARLGNLNSYELTEKQVNKICRDLQEWCDAAKNAIQNPTKSGGTIKETYSL